MTARAVQAMRERNHGGKVSRRKVRRIGDAGREGKGDAEERRERRRKEKRRRKKITTKSAEAEGRARHEGNRSS